MNPDPQSDKVVSTEEVTDTATPLDAVTLATAAGWLMSIGGSPKGCVVIADHRVAIRESLLAIPPAPRRERLGLQEISEGLA